MIIERIRRKIEPDMCIVPQTTPVIWFGNYEHSKACTISLNPSDKEFLDHKGKLLDNDKVRLCTRKKLNKNDSDELTNTEVEIVIDCCNKYFRTNPYGWFTHFDNFIKRFGYSYYEGSCVHLDLIQWATKPTWDTIPLKIKQKHLDTDLQVLEFLLNNKKDFEVMFLNGKKVAENVSEHLKVKLNNKTSFLMSNNGTQKRLEMYFGKYNEIQIIGWNLVLQYGVNQDALYENIKNNQK